VSAGGHRGGKDMSIVRVWQLESSDEIEVVLDHRIRHSEAHQAARSVKVVGTEIRPVRDEIVEALIENPLGPAGPVLTGDCEAEEQIPDTGGVQHICTRAPPPGGPRSVQAQFLSFGG